MKNKTQAMMKLLVVTLLTLTMYACSLPIDKEVVIEDESWDTVGPKMLLTSYFDFSGKFMSTMMSDYFRIINGNSEGYEILAYEPPDFDLENWRENEKAWAQETSADKSPELISIPWDRKLIDTAYLKTMEGIEAYQVESLRNPYVVPLGTYMYNFQIRRSELIRVLGQESMEEIDQMSLMEILDLYYASEDAKRYIFEYELIDLAAEQKPMGLPTPARIHHGRTHVEDVVELARKAHDLKAKWKLEFGEDYDLHVGVIDHSMNPQGMNSGIIGDLNERDLYLLRPSWEDPIPFGVATSIGNSNDYMTKRFIDDMLREKTQMALYVISDNDWHGGYYSPVSPVVHDEISELENSVIDYGVAASREFYKNWLDQGPWEPAIMYSDETFDKYYDLKGIIFESLVEDEVDWVSFEKEARDILERK